MVWYSVVWYLLVTNVINLSAVNQFSVASPIAVKVATVSMHIRSGAACVGRDDKHTEELGRRILKN